MAEPVLGAPTSGPYNIPLGNKPYSVPDTVMGIEECENLYVEYSGSETSTAPYYYVSIPGLKLYNAETSSTSAACRGLYTTGTGKVFGAWSNQLFEIFSNGDRSFVGQLLSFSGPISCADNGFQMIVVDGMAGYTVNLTSGVFAQITDEYFPGIADNDDTKAPTKVVCIDTYFIVNKQNSNEYYWSTANYKPYAFDMDQPTKLNVWNGLQFGIKLGDSDEIVGLEKSNNLVWLFGRQSIEVHYNTGDYQGQLFGRVSNALINFGCSAPNSICRFANELYWIGSDRSGSVGIYMAGADYMPTRISTEGIESQFQNLSTYSDAISYVYSADGHAFVVIYFPSGNLTLVYDIFTKSWHKRTRYDYVTGMASAWRALYTTYGHGKNIVGDRLGDAMYVLDSKYYANDDPDGTGINYIQRIKTTPVALNTGKMARYKTFQLIMQQGVGLINDTPEGVGRNPKAMISWSNDSGKSWSNEREVELGMIGEYGKRTRLTTLGTARNRVWKIRITEPVKVVIGGLLVDFDSGTR